MELDAKRVVDPANASDYEGGTRGDAATSACATSRQPGSEHSNDVATWSGMSGGTPPVPAVVTSAEMPHWQCRPLEEQEGDEDAGGEEAAGECALACIADASESERSRTIAWLTDMAMADVRLPGGMGADNIPALSDFITRMAHLRSSAERAELAPSVQAARLAAGRLRSAASLPSASPAADALMRTASAHGLPIASDPHSLPCLREDASLPFSQAAWLPARAQQAPAAMAPPLPPLSPSPSAFPRHLPFSQEALNSMGMAVRPLAMREVRALTLALVEAIMERSMVRLLAACQVTTI